MQTKLLIDADFFWYRAASAAEDEQDYSPDLTVIVGDFKRGKQIVKQELKKLTTRFDSNDLILYFTDTKNFRKEIDPNYKGNRTKTARTAEAETPSPEACRASGAGPPVVVRRRALGP